MYRAAVLLIAASAASCNPPASDEYVERSRIGELSERASDPLPSPDTEGAIWAPAAAANRLLYGKPGERPLMALECIDEGAQPRIGYTRFALADREAKAILALIGNGHVARLMIDAERVNDAWLWRGSVPARSPELEVLTGPRQVEATVPGAGTVVLNPSSLPAGFIETCRSLSVEEAEPADEEDLPEDPA